MIAAPKQMTVEEFLALPPDDTVERLLIDGELREHPAMAYRYRYHSCSMTLAATRLQVWLESQPEPRGQVFTGDVGFRIPTEPSTLFGLDIAYVPADMLAASPANSTIIHGLSPNVTLFITTL